MAVQDNDITADVMAVAPEEEEVRVCLFTMGEDTYAIPVDVLMEIIIPQKIFPVPTTPSHVLGVINLRGTIVPIVDIRPALSLPAREQAGQIAVVKYGAAMLGIVVDAVSAVVGVPESSILAVPAESGRTGNRFFTGIIQRESGHAALLNIERIIEEIKLS